MADDGNRVDGPARSAPENRKPANLPRFPILFRVIVLSAVLIAVLTASIGYLGRQMAHGLETLEQQMQILSTVTTANAANKAFGDLKYWLTDFAASLLMRSHLNALEARIVLHAELDELEPYDPKAVASIRGEVDAMFEQALLAIDAYTNNERVLGNSLMSKARIHIHAADDHLGTLVQNLEWDAFAKRDEALRRRQEALDVAVVIAVLATIFGATLTFLVIRSIRHMLSERDRFAEERSRARLALVEREKHLDAIVTTVADAIITIDGNGTVRTFNPAASHMFGYHGGEVVGRNVKMLMTGADRDRHDDYLETHRETGRSKLIGRTRELEGRRKDGSTFPMQLSVSVMEVAGERMYAGIMRDISELKRRERELLHAKEDAEVASKAKTEFLTNMSHELRTPLNAIIGFSDMMRSQLLGPLGSEHYRQYCEDIHGSGSHLLQVINDILDMSKIEAGEMRLHDSEIDVEKVAGSSLRLVADRARRESVTVDRELSGKDFRLIGDERMFKQILLNLLSNAVKFTPEGGLVTLRGGIGEGGGWWFSVVDTGIGIAPEDIELVTSPFGQVDSRLQRKFDGTGLGLPLVKSMIELHGGALKIDSTVDVGTSCTITFPPERTLSYADLPQQLSAG